MTLLKTPYGYDDGYIYLEVHASGLPDHVNINADTLYLKGELHISLLCAKKIAALIDSERADEIQQELVKEFISFTSTTPLDSFKPSKTFRLVKRNDRQTIVMMVDVPNLDKLFNHLSQKYGGALPLQPTHITLYTLQPEAGIGILSRMELERDSELVEVADLTDKSLSAQTLIL